VSFYATKLTTTAHDINNVLAPTNMPRTIFVNPFKSHDVSEFPDVLRPLDEAPIRASAPKGQRPSIAPTASDRSNSEKTGKEDKPENELRRPDSNASSGIVNHGMTVEALKAEIIADVAAADTDTPYDRRAIL
jgi:hypothetical protein